MDASDAQKQVIRDIIAERCRQDGIYGQHNRHSMERWLVILMEEVGEVSNALIERDLENYYTELIQVAAVCVAAAECLKELQTEENNGDKHNDSSSNTDTRGQSIAGG